MSAANRGGPGQKFWLALGAVAVVGIGALGYVASRPRADISVVDPSLPIIQSEGYVLGNPAAPVEVIEFADFECPACATYATITEPDVRTRLVNTGRVRVRYIDYPLEIHKNTWSASLAAACANDQGKFWEMHDVIFANQDKWNTEATKNPRAVLEGLARGVGLDMTKYGACMNADTHRTKIQAHLRKAEERQVQQTPSFVIGGKLIPGALPYDVFKKYVDDAGKTPSTSAAESAATPKAGRLPAAGPARGALAVPAGTKR